MVINHPRMHVANDNRYVDIFYTHETGDDILADMAGCTVEYKGRINKYHEAAELIQEYTKRLLDLWERR